MFRSRRSVALSVSLLISLAGSSAHGLKLICEARIDPTVTGGVNGGQTLSYDLTGKHETFVDSFFPAEGLSPLFHQGFFKRMESVGSTMIGSCSDPGFVVDGSFNCDSNVQFSCPSAQGTYRAETRGAALTQVKVGFSGQYFANCPPIAPNLPPCGFEYPYTRLFVVDLDSGRTFQPAPIAGHTLERTEVRDGKSFFFPEWAVLQMGGAEAGAVLPATTDVAAPIVSSSALASSRVAEYAERLQEPYPTPPVGRFLVIEAPRHLGDRRDPLVRLSSLAEGKPPAGDLADGRVLFRAELDEHGVLDRVDVLAGDAPTARALAADLLDGAGHHDATGSGSHRTVVFAAFQVEDDRPRVVAVVPVLPQCCCLFDPGGC